MYLGDHPVELSVFAYLYEHGESPQTTVANDLDVSPDALARHLKRLANAGTVELDESVEDGHPRTTVALTDDGESIFENYVHDLGERISALE